MVAVKWHAFSAHCVIIHLSNKNWKIHNVSKSVMYICILHASAVVFFFSSFLLHLSRFSVSIYNITLCYFNCTSPAQSSIENMRRAMYSVYAAVNEKKKIQLIFVWRAHNMQRTICIYIFLNTFFSWQYDASTGSAALFQQHSKQSSIVLYMPKNIYIYFRIMSMYSVHRQTVLRPLLHNSYTISIFLSINFLFLIIKRYLRLCIEPHSSFLHSFFFYMYVISFFVLILSSLYFFFLTLTRIQFAIQKFFWIVSMVMVEWIACQWIGASHRFK